MAHGLTAKQSEAIEYIDANGNAGPYRQRTLTSLVERELIASTHPSSTDAAYNYRVTAKGYALFSKVNRRHVNGRTVSDPNAPTFRALDVVAYRRDAVRPTRPASALDAVDEPADQGTVNGYSAKPGQRVYVIDASDPETVLAGTVQPASRLSAGVMTVQLDDGSIRRPVLALTLDGLRATYGGSEEFETAQREAPRPLVMLHDYQRGEAMHVLGQTFGAVGVDGLEELLFRYENDDQSPDAPYRSIPFSQLRYSHYYVAICPHAFENQGAGCLTCNPFPSTDHLIGRMVTLDPIDNPRRGTVSGVLARTERGSSSDHVVGVLRSGHRVRVPRSLVEATLANLPKTSA